MEVLDVIKVKNSVYYWIIGRFTAKLKDIV